MTNFKLITNTHGVSVSYIAARHEELSVTGPENLNVGYPYVGVVAKKGPSTFFRCSLPKFVNCGQCITDRDINLFLKQI